MLVIIYVFSRKISVLESAFKLTSVQGVEKWRHLNDLIETLTHKLILQRNSKPNVSRCIFSLPVSSLLAPVWKLKGEQMLPFTFHMCAWKKKSHLCRSSLLNHSHIDVSLFFFSLLLSALSHKAFPCTLCTAFSLFFICFKKFSFLSLFHLIFVRIEWLVEFSWWITKWECFYLNMTGFDISIYYI